MCGTVATTFAMITFRGKDGRRSVRKCSLLADSPEFGGHRCDQKEGGILDVNVPRWVDICSSDSNCLGISGERYVPLVIIPEGIADISASGERRSNGFKKKQTQEKENSGTILSSNQNHQNTRTAFVGRFGR